jgi:hypothetical protein
MVCVWCRLQSLSDVRLQSSSGARRYFLDILKHRPPRKERQTELDNGRALFPNSTYTRLFRGPGRNPEPLFL